MQTERASPHAIKGMGRRLARARNYVKRYRSGSLEKRPVADERLARALALLGAEAIRNA